MIERGEFREDLYYRLNAATLKLPALRDRAEDIPRLLPSDVLLCTLSFGIPNPGRRDRAKPTWLDMSRCDHVAAVLFEDLERELYRQASVLTGGNQSRMAVLLGLSRTTVREKLGRYSGADSGLRMRQPKDCTIIPRFSRQFGIPAH